MGLTTILRGFKVPVSVLDRFFESNNIMPTDGYPPTYDPVQIPGHPPIPTLDPHSTFLRAKLAATPAGAADVHNQNTRIFIPNREGMAKSTHAYVAYAYVMVFAQRQMDIDRELPGQAPPGFAELRKEILGFATREEEDSGLLSVEGMQPGSGNGGAGTASMLFVVLTDEREYPWKGPFMRESDRRCDQCTEEFENWLNLQEHRKEAHGVVRKRSALPDDL